MQIIPIMMEPLTGTAHGANKNNRMITFKGKFIHGPTYTTMNGPFQCKISHHYTYSRLYYNIYKRIDHT